MKTYTCIATCRTCGQELNRAVGVPEDERLKVSLGAPLVALCLVRDHNTLPDCMAAGLGRGNAGRYAFQNLMNGLNKFGMSPEHRKQFCLKVMGALLVKRSL